MKRTPSSEPKAGESPASLASNSEDMPPDGRSVKGIVVPPTTPQSNASSNSQAPHMGVLPRCFFISAICRR